MSNKPKYITDDDILVTNPRDIGDSLKDVIEEQREDIEKLKSNMKFIYSYGGVGGSGKGGSGGGGSAKEPKLYAELQHVESGEIRQINLDINNINPLILPKPGTYRFYAKLRNSGGEKFILKYATGSNSINLAPRNPLTDENNHEFINDNLVLTTNGAIKVYLEDTDENVLCNISQRYIVNPHDFDISFMYNSNGNTNRYDSGNEHFLGDATKDPFINISYDIHLPQASDIFVTYSIGDFVSEEIECNKSTDTIKIFLKDITKDGGPFLRNENTGTYKVSVLFRYKSSVVTEQQTASGEFNISLIPSYLFINVRPSRDVLYDSIEEIQSEIDDQTIPKRTLNLGAYLSLYSKVYDGRVGSYYEKYQINYIGYELDGDEWVQVNSGTDSVDEQKESTVGISFNFNTPGIKKLVLKTESNKNGLSYTVEKYIFVKDFDDLVAWPVTNFDYYFKSNDTPKYSVNNLDQVTFPDNIFGDSLFEQKFTNNPVELSHPSWIESIGTDTDITTVLSFGIQLSNINTEHSVILEAFSYQNSTYKLYTDALFAPDPDSNVNKIFVPTEDYNAIDGTKYHLVQICRHKTPQGQYVDYLYIDGKLESCKQNIETLPATISRIVLNNVNAAYNLINLQYYPSANLNIDAVTYRYWLAYKQRYINNAIGIDITDVEKQVLTLAENNSLKFDGQNVIVDKTTVETIARSVDIPTLMIDYTLEPKYASEQEFMNTFLMGYLAGDTGSFGNKDVRIWWCGGRLQTNNPVLNRLCNENGLISFGGLTGYWQFSFQGTSTMANRIKNFSLRIITSNSGDDLNKLSFSPRFNKEDSSTFLPETEWTLKADIADSAHANNTSVGKFVNRVCSKFNTNLPPSRANDYVKNTLEGFPILLFFRCNSDNLIYYLGVYNFNLGRESYNNLGYNTDISDVYVNASESTADDFAYSYSRGIFNDQLAVGEVQENMGLFDFSQTEESLLFAGAKQVGQNPHMFGTDSKIKAANVNVAKGTLRNFVKGVAKAGTFCFNMIGKEFMNPQLPGGGFSNDVYKNVNCVTDPSHQIYYMNDGTADWKTTTEYDPANMDNDTLLELLSYHLSDGTSNDPKFDYRSGSEYYTICMAFGLVDSILKNMNIKSWNNSLCYCAFYDMDCAFGEDNSGNETVSYMAATDYWYSTKRNGILRPVNVNYDYWDEVNGGKGFDFTSSFLLAVIKYAKPICNYIEELKDTPLDNFPQDFWAKLRGVNGELRNTDYFLNEYFKSGVHMIPEYLTSLNYKVKYLYTDESGIPLANATAFNGTRYAKVKDWLTKRLHFLDVMFNVQGINQSIKENIVIPSPTIENKNAVTLNPDVVILKDAFSGEEVDKSISSNTKVVNIYAPKNTPMIVYTGGTANIYILPENTNDRENPNKIQISTTIASRTKIFGSKEFIDVSDIGVFFTEYKTIDSDKLENVIYENAVVSTQTDGLTIKSVSVRNVKLNIPTYSGTLTLQDRDNTLIGSSITSIDISNSGFVGSFSNFPNLMSMNISSVNSTSNISISGNPQLLSENLIISGANYRSLTTLNSLVIQDVAGDFNITNSAINELSITGVLDENGNAVAEFSIEGDLALRSLTLRNMKKIRIINCPNLENLSIWGSENSEDGTDGTCKSLEIDMSGYLNHKDITPKLKTITSTGNSNPEDGYFNLDTDTFKNLNFLTIRALENIEVLELPNNEIYIGTFRSCKNLSIIKTEGTNSKIILTGPSTFEDCPMYWMRNSEAANNKGIGNVTSNQYTKMGISPECTDLSSTFALGIVTSGDNFSLYNARYFIENVIDNDAAQRITTLANCFYNRSEIRYNSKTAYQDDNTYGSKAPTLSRFISLKDITQMYYGASVDVLTSHLLSLPDGDEYNIPENTLKWDSFIKRGDLTVSIDCFKNVSYRITSLNDLTLTLMEPNQSVGIYTYITNTEDNRYDILDLFGIKTDPDTGKLIPLENISNISSLNFNANQYIDFSRFFEVLPNVTTIDNFLNSNLDNFYLEGLLKPCENLRSIVNSFTTSPTNNPIDLWEFFNWNANEDILLLFSSTDDNSSSFNLNKTVTYDNLLNIFDCITNYTNLTKLTNIFCNCKVTGYNDLGKPEIKFADGTVLDKIKSINHLFTNMSSDRADQGLSFSRTLFVQLPNVEKLRMTFSGVRFTEMFSMDFFARRNDTPQSKEVYLLTGLDPNDDSCYEKHTLYTYDYRKTIVDLNNTFYNARFVSCTPWYDINKDNVDIDENYICTLGGTRLNNVSRYYICDNRDYYTLSYGDGFTSTINCTDNIIRSNVSVPYSTILGDIYVKKNSNKYEGYVKSGSEYNMVFSNIPGFTSVFNKCYEVTDTEYRIFTIDRYNIGTYTGYELSTPEIDDNFNNFTHYVKNIEIDNTSGDHWPEAWNNHNIMGEYGQFNTTQSVITESTSMTDLEGKDFVFKYNNCDLYPTYCILPPDMLYGCYTTVDLTGTFSDINAMGVIPRHFTSTCAGKNIPDLLRNTNVLPNIQYYYRVYTFPNETFNNILAEIPSIRFDDYDVLNGDEVIDRIEYQKPGPGEEYDDIAVVIYRDENGNLRRRSVNNKDREKAQFVFAPKNFSTSIDIRNTFDFRYNLPPNITIIGEYVNEEELINRTYDPLPGATGLDSFYVQYFIMMDDSAKWSIVSDARNPFIKDGYDVDYTYGKMRNYYFEPSATFENAWTRNSSIQEAGGWFNNVRQTFNCMLNLCGTTDKYTSCVEDSGCPINLDNSVKLDNFLDGNLVTFLNGRVFNKLIDVADFTTSANKINSGSYIVIMPNIAKNIILPAFRYDLYDENFTFINGNGSNESEYNFYPFMFNDDTSDGPGTSVYNYMYQFTKIAGQKYLSVRTGTKKYVHN